MAILVSILLLIAGVGTGLYALLTAPSAVSRREKQTLMLFGACSIAFLTLYLSTILGA